MICKRYQCRTAETSRYSDWHGFDGLQEDACANAFMVATDSFHAPAGTAQHILELRDGALLSVKREVHLHTTVRVSTKAHRQGIKRTCISRLYTNSFTVP